MHSNFNFQTSTSWHWLSPFRASLPSSLIDENQDSRFWKSVLSLTDKFPELPLPSKVLIILKQITKSQEHTPLQRIFLPKIARQLERLNIWPFTRLDSWTSSGSLRSMTIPLMLSCSFNVYYVLPESRVFSEVPRVMKFNPISQQLLPAMVDPATNWVWRRQGIPVED
jgi:hypothetical protein